MDKRNILQLYSRLEKKSFVDLYHSYYENKREYIRSKNKDSKKLMKIIQFIIDNKDLSKEENDIIQSNYRSYPDYSDVNFNTEISKNSLLLSQK